MLFSFAYFSIFKRISLKYISSNSSISVIQNSRAIFSIIVFIYFLSYPNERAVFKIFCLVSGETDNEGSLLNNLETVDGEKPAC